MKSADDADNGQAFRGEIERPSRRAATAPPRGHDIRNDSQRHGERTLLAEDDRRRRPVNDGGRQAPEQATTGKERELAGSMTAAAAQDRSLPPDIEKRFYIREDRNGDRRIYADSKGTLEIFQENKNRLRTRINDVHAVGLMLDTAVYRGWSSILVKGSQEFRREAWLEGQARGIAVTGYKPTELDRQELKQREQSYLRNEIAPEFGRDRQARANDVGGRRGIDGDSSTPPGGAPGQPMEHTRADRRSRDYKTGIEGSLIEQGARPYRDNEKNAPSPYIILEDETGRRHTVWGVGLPEALMKAGAKQGDLLRLRETNKERVVKSVLRDVDGKLTHVTQEVDRRGWEAQVVQERETTSRQAGDDADDPGRSSATSRTATISAAERPSNFPVSRPQVPVHGRKSRAAGDEEIARANEDRARKYMASSRVISARDPELRAAATLEAYVERKLRATFPEDPVAISRCMAAARSQISQVIARGQTFPTPRVFETHEVDKTANELAGSGHDDKRLRETATSRAPSAREKTREHKFDIARSR